MMSGRAWQLAMARQPFLFFGLKIKLSSRGYVYVSRSGARQQCFGAN